MSPRLEHLDDSCCNLDGVLLDLKIPDTHDAPTSFREGGVVPLVSSDVALDFLVPIAVPPVGLPLAWVAVPEGAINKDSYPRAREGDVDATTWARPVASPSPNSQVPQSSTKSEFGLRVLAPNAGHDPTPSFGRGGRRAQLV